MLSGFLLGFCWDCAVLHTEYTDLHNGTTTEQQRNEKFFCYIVIRNVGEPWEYLGFIDGTNVTTLHERNVIDVTIYDIVPRSYKNENNDTTIMSVGLREILAYR